MTHIKKDSFQMKNISILIECNMVKLRYLGCFSKQSADTCSALFICA